jgi:hypothetical protein
VPCFISLQKFRQKEKFKIRNFAKKKGSDFARFLVTRTEERKKKNSKKIDRFVNLFSFHQRYVESNSPDFKEK